MKHIMVPLDLVKNAYEMANEVDLFDWRHTRIGLQNVLNQPTIDDPDEYQNLVSENKNMAEYILKTQPKSKLNKICNGE